MIVSTTAATMAVVELPGMWLDGYDDRIYCHGCGFFFAYLFKNESIIQRLYNMAETMIKVDMLSMKNTGVSSMSIHPTDLTNSIR